MHVDKDLIFSENQAITATAASTNTIDTGDSRDIGPGEPLQIEAHVTEAFNTLTSLKIAVETDDNASFSSATELTSVSMTLAQLTLNKTIGLGFLPHGCERYVRLKYTVTGTNPTLGKIWAAIVPVRQSNV